MENPCLVDIIIQDMTKLVQVILWRKLNKSIGRMFGIYSMRMAFGDSLSL